jgi:Mg2+ and Co2+ transporter CorA
MAKKRERTAPDPIIAEARERWNRCNDAEDKQRKAILEAKKFRSGDQWPDSVRKAREGAATIAGQAAQPPRPCLTVDRLSPPIRRIGNNIRSAHFSIDVLPNADGADQEVAEIFKGYMRHVEVSARDEEPIEWAADGAIESGLGWFRILADYVKESPDDSNLDQSLFYQELKLGRITNSLSVYCDPSAMRPTRSDAQFMFVTEDLFRDEFKRLYKDADLNSLDDFAATGDMDGWVSDDMIRIAEYWKIVYEDTEYALLTSGRVVSGKDIPKDEDKIQSKRKVRKPIVKGYKISATQILERWEWLGSHIPIIPIFGEELNVDGKVILRGVIQEGMDAQRMINYTYSGAMEIFALAPKAPFIAAAGQIENYKGMWQTSNTFNYAALIYDPISVSGTVLGPPQRNATEAPIEAAVALMRTSEEAVKATTDIGDPALGNYNTQDHSGKAIDSLKAQSDLATSIYPLNVQRARVYAGELMVEIIPKLVQPGQILHIMGADDDPQQVMVGKPFQHGKDGKPIASPPNVTPEMAKLPDSLHKFYDLSQGRYSVTVVSGKATATLREEGSEALGQLIPHLPPEMQMVVTPEYVDQLPFPGSHKIAGILRKALPPQLQQSEDGQPNPAMLQQKLQQSGQMIEQLTAHVNDMTEQIKTKQVENQAMIQKAQLDNQTKIEIARINQEGAFAVADLKATVEASRTAIAEMAELRQALEEAHGRIHDAKEQAREHAHDHILSAQEHAQELEQAQVEHAHALEQGQAGHQQQLEQTQQAADLAPEPTQGASA